MMQQNDIVGKTVRGCAWAMLGLSMLFCWSLTVHNWTVQQLSKHAPSEVADQ